MTDHNEPSGKDLGSALYAIASMISKCEKVQPKLREGSAQATLLANRIQALRIASALVSRELEGRDQA